LFSAITAQAQTPDVEDMLPLPEQQSVQVDSRLIEPSELIDLAAHAFPAESAKDDNRRNLPDMPHPKGESDKDQASLSQDGKRRPGGWLPRDYDPLHLSEPDPSWGRAMAHPVILIPSALLVGLTVVQLIKTDRCIDANKPTCNLLFRKNRAAVYGFNIPYTAGVVWMAGRMKQKGHGMGSILLTAFSLIYEETLAHTANPRFLTCQPGRIPQCQ